MKPRAVVAILAVVLVIYFALIGYKAVISAGNGGLVGWGLALAAVLLPIVGAVLLFSNFDSAGVPSNWGGNSAPKAASPRSRTCPNYRQGGSTRPLHWCISRPSRPTPRRRRRIGAAGFALPTPMTWPVTANARGKRCAKRLPCTVSPGIGHHPQWWSTKPRHHLWVG